MVYQGRLWNEVVAVWREDTVDDGMGGVVSSWGSEAYIARYHCRIYKPDMETTYEDEGRRDESIFVFRGQIKDIRVGDKFVRSGGTEMIVVMLKRPNSDRGPHDMKGWLREIQPPQERPGED
jgi:hypothetical protein